LRRGRKCAGYSPPRLRLRRSGVGAFHAHLPMPYPRPARWLAAALVGSLGPPAAADTTFDFRTTTIHVIAPEDTRFHLNGLWSVGTRDFSPFLDAHGGVGIRSTFPWHLSPSGKPWPIIFLGEPDFVRHRGGAGGRFGWSGVDDYAVPPIDPADKPRAEWIDLPGPSGTGRTFTIVLPAPAALTEPDLAYVSLSASLSLSGGASSPPLAGQAGKEEKTVDVEPDGPPVLPAPGTPPAAWIGLTGVLGLVGYGLWPRRPRRQSRFA
jgi:hypothetical protein